MGTDKKTRHNMNESNQSNMPFIIRRCTLEDLDGVIAVNERELPEDYPYFFYKSIIDNFSEAFLVAIPRDDPKIIIGYIMWRIEKVPSINSLRIINKGHLVSIAVSKEYRRKGVATALLKNSMPEIKKYNIREYVLEVRVSNYQAISLYETFDYDVGTIKKGYYKDGENAYYMTLKLDDN